jgi:beta-phosphoglucomutase family hydrolase
MLPASEQSAPAAPGSRWSGRLGLPEHVRACLFDLDGVLTNTAALHAAAWRAMFDGYLRTRADATGAAFVAFDEVRDYDTYVDGRSRADGTRSFLRSRGIDLPTGHPTDGPTAATITGLGAAKNVLFLQQVHRAGVAPYPGSLRYVRAVLTAGLSTAVVSSSANCAEILDAAGIAGLFQVRIDGVSIGDLHLAGKPAPDAYLAAARELGVAPRDAAVFEDAQSGVAAGRAGGFGYVVGVDRVGQAAQLSAEGADLVVTDLARLLDPVGPG